MHIFILCFIFETAFPFFGFTFGVLQEGVTKAADTRVIEYIIDTLHTDVYGNSHGTINYWFS